MKPVPLLFLSDAPTAGTGLGRITRDLAVRVNQFLPDKFRVGTLGYGGPYSRTLGFPQYELGMKDWVAYNLPEVWEDFAGDEHGIIMSIWDASRLLWFARPENFDDVRLKKFLNSGKFDRWAYLPMDATGPNDKLTAILGHVISAYDRVLGYSKWAHGILERTLSDVKDLDLDWRPHGIDTSVFYPRNYRAARNGFGERLDAKNSKGKFLTIPSDHTLVGIVATNQIRKDYGLGFQTVAELSKIRQGKVILWIHTDALERHWSIPALVHDFGFDYDKICCVCGVQVSDEKMAWCYSACDVTLGIGMGEGFGYPIFESLACGTPCVHGDYGGAPEHMPGSMLAIKQQMRLEGCYNCWRPVYSLGEWVNRVCVQEKKTCETLLPAHLDWNNLWPSWSEWFTKGLPLG